MSFIDTLLDPRNRRYVLFGSVFFAVLAAVLIAVVVVSTRNTNNTTADDLIKESSQLLIVGANFLASNLRAIQRNSLVGFNFNTTLKEHPTWGNTSCTSCNTDLARLKEGGVKSIFFVASTDCAVQYRDGSSRTWEQIDVIKRLIKRYPNDIELVTTSQGIEDAPNNKKIAALIAVGGGYAIDSRLAFLRLLYELGVRYMTLTPGCNIPWIAGSLNSTSANTVLYNLTAFGENVVYEMNRLGMIIDLSGSHQDAMGHVLSISKAPVIFSQSAAYGLNQDAANVPDETLELLKNNGGIIMVTFDKPYVAENVTASNYAADDVIAQINYIVDKIGIDYVGIGSSYDSPNTKPVDLEDVSKFPYLFKNLPRSNASRWTTENLAKLAGDNFLRVFKAVEQIKETLSNQEPYADWIPDADFAAAVPGGSVWQCRSRN